MNEIKCPHCGDVFKVDASGYADIVKQVRDAEFSRDLDERVKAVQREGEQALELERSRSTAALQEAESQRNAQLVEQKNAAAQELAQEVARRDAELAELRAKLEGAAAERESASQRAAVEARADAQKENAELQREIDSSCTAWTHGRRSKACRVGGAQRCSKRFSCTRRSDCRAAGQACRGGQGPGDGACRCRGRVAA